MTEVDREAWLAFRKCCYQVPGEQQGPWLRYCCCDHAREIQTLGVLNEHKNSFFEIALFHHQEVTSVHAPYSICRASVEFLPANTMWLDFIHIRVLYAACTEITSWGWTIICSKHVEDIVEITNTMHKFAPLLYSYMLAPTCFGSSPSSSQCFWIHLSYVKIQIDMVIYHIMWLSGLCVWVSWFSLLWYAKG
jgi:hypothetical protein